MALLLFAAAILAAVYYVWGKRHLIYLNWQLGGPIPYPIIGSAHLFLNPNKTIGHCCRLIERFGDVFAVWAGPEMYVCVVNADGCADVLRNATLEKGISYTFLERLGGMGLFTLNGERWSYYRKHINPTFRHANHQLLMPAMNRHGRIFVESLQAEADDGEEFNVRPIAARYVIDVAMDLLVDHDVGIQKGRNPDFIAAINSIMHIIAQRMFNPLLQPMSLYRWSKEYQIETDRIDNVVNPLFTKVIETHIETNEQRKNADGVIDSPKFLDDLVRLHTDEGKISFQDVIDHSKNIIMAAYDTTTSTLSFLLLMLAMHPEWQQRCYDEIVAANLPDDHDWTMEDLAQLDCLDRCFKEVLRLFPAGSYVERQTTEPTIINGYTVPRGVQIVLAIIHLHRSPKYYAHPELFDPDHFLPEQVKQRHPYAYVPFAHGPRSCIGTRFANTTLRVGALNIVRNFVITTSLKLEDLQLRFDISLNVQNGFKVAFQRRAARV